MMIKSLLFYFVLTMFVDGEPVWQIHHSFATQKDCLVGIVLLTKDTEGMVLTGDCGGTET